MRLFILLSVLVFIPLTANAQAEDKSNERRYYNSQGGYGSQIYNSSSSGSRGPLSIKQLLQGKSSAADGSSAYYGGSDFRPYGMDEGFSLALSPSQVSESRNKRDALARQYEREAMDSLQRSQSEELTQETSGYLNSFQNANSPQVQGTTRQPIQRRVFTPKKNDFEKPKRVFNSIY